MGLRFLQAVGLQIPKLYLHFCKILFSCAVQQKKKNRASFQVVILIYITYVGKCASLLLLFSYWNDWPDQMAVKTTVHFFQHPHYFLCHFRHNSAFFVKTEKGVVWIHVGAAPRLSLSSEAASSVRHEAGTPTRWSVCLQNKSWPVNVLDCCKWWY